MEHRRGILFILFLMAFGILFTVGFVVMFHEVGGYIFQRDEKIVFSEVSNSPWFMIFMQVMIMIVPLFIWLSVFGEKIKNHLPNERLGKKNVLYVIALSLLIMPLANIISGLTSIFFPNEVSEIVYGALENNPLVPMLLAVAVAPAICEEIVFRGYLQSTFKNKPLIIMLLANGFFFAIIHHSPQQFFYTFAMGIFFAYIVHATRSIFASIISHFVMNASSVILAWLSLSHPEPSEQPELLPALMSWGVIAIFTTTAAVFLFRKFVAHNNRKKEDPTSGGG